MQTISTDSRPVVLPGGRSVPLAAVHVLWAFEDRGLTIRLARDGGLLVGPRDRLTATDRKLIRMHKNQLIRLVSYCDAVVV